VVAKLSEVNSYAALEKLIADWKPTSDPLVHALVQATHCDAPVNPATCMNSPPHF